MSPVTDVGGSEQLRIVPADEWDWFAARFDDVRQEQIASFNGVRWHGAGLEYLIVERDGREVAGAVVVMFNVPHTSRGIAFVKWGPLWQLSGHRRDPENLRCALRLIRREYGERRGLFLSVLPQIDADDPGLVSRELDALGFSQGAGLRYPLRYLVNTTIDTGELRTSLEQKWRYNLKKAHRNDLSIGWADGHTGLAEFMKLYEAMLERKQFQDTSAIATLDNLMQSPVERHRPAIALVRHDDRVTAGAVIDRTGDCAVYLYGATDDRALPFRAGYAMHWWIAEQLCADPQCRWYDLGGSDGDKGLHQFKKGFVGKSGVMIDTPVSHDYADTLAAATIGRAVFLLRDFKGTCSRQIHRFSQLLNG